MAYSHAIIVATYAVKNVTEVTVRFAAFTRGTEGVTARNARVRLRFSIHVAMWLRYEEISTVCLDINHTIKLIMFYRFLVKDFNGSPDTRWWNSIADGAAYIDFTNPMAAQWFTNHLIDLRASSGVDGFKFDAGETSWAPAVR